ncbi:phage scaffolding protein [Aneurinibacillus thermoaerophilus]|uniref:phage scaffolding protein n=1 Tax=Aneurinibacillus thermoaerophilus TaxID=143495 RepID=UPI002E243271|nr:phage scaffolding protein [Aneurinibacillus thermoaerophilus]MED0766033.1 phage scaffolding protein [Aneurinibacillus thermoaerophilus]
MKELLEKLAKGEATVDEVLAAIDNDKKDYVPRSRLNEKNEEIKQLQNQIKERDEQVEQLKKAVKGNEKLEQTIADLQKQNEEWESKYKQSQIDTAIKLAAKDAKDPADVLAFVNREGLELNEDGTVKGLDEALKGLRESKPYLFESPGLRGRTPNPPKDNQQTVVNPWKKETFNLTEQGRLLRENPELAKQLQESAN